jgi:hypothetical protein
VDVAEADDEDVAVADAGGAQLEAPLPAVVPLGHGRHDVEPAAL